VNYTQFGSITTVFLIMYTLGNITLASARKPATSPYEPHGRHLRVPLHLQNLRVPLHLQTMTTTTGRKPTVYFGVARVADWLDVQPGTVSKWLERYDDWPAADMLLTPGRSGVPDRGWLLSRRPEWEAWKAARPGQGAPGRPRPRKINGEET
jgi:hypothetical protein